MSRWQELIKFWFSNKSNSFFNNFTNAGSIQVSMEHDDSPSSQRVTMKPVPLFLSHNIFHMKEETESLTIS